MDAAKMEYSNIKLFIVLILERQGKWEIVVNLNRSHRQLIQDEKVFLERK